MYEHSSVHPHWQILITISPWVQWKATDLSGIFCCFLFRRHRTSECHLGLLRTGICLTDWRESCTLQSGMFVTSCNFQCQYKPSRNFSLQQFAMLHRSFHGSMEGLVQRNSSQLLLDSSLPDYDLTLHNRAVLMNWSPYAIEHLSFESLSVAFSFLCICKWFSSVHMPSFDSNLTIPWCMSPFPLVVIKGFLSNLLGPKEIKDINFCW